MRFRLQSLLFVLALTLMGCSAGHNTSSALPAQTTASVLTPGAGQLYHGVFPGDAAGAEDAISPSDVTSYEQTVGAQVAWVYFSHEWMNGRTFPVATAAWIRDRGSVPFIRLMLRSSSCFSTAPDPVFTLQAITSGTFDDDLRAWARDAKAFASPLIVEYGTECNGHWFGWNGTWNGGQAGPARFIAAFRHIVLLMRAEGATNITWVFHADAVDDPNVEWNHFEHYYPGDDVVDWIGFSAYGAQCPTDTPPIPRLRDDLDQAYARAQHLAPGKPVFLLETGCTSGNPNVQPDSWTRDAFTDLLGGRWPHLYGFSWWNSHWTNDGIPADDSNLRVQDLPQVAAVLHAQLAGPQVLKRPLFSKLRRTPPPAQPEKIVRH